MGKLFGEFIRDRRERLLRGDPRYSIRKVAERIRVHHSYLSKIERGEPGNLSEKKVQALARELDLDTDLLLAMNGRISEELARAVMRNPERSKGIINKFKEHCGGGSGDGECDYSLMLERVGRLLGGTDQSVLRHELRTPLAGIVSAVEAVSQERSIGEDSRELLQAVRASAGRLLQLLDSSLALALLENGDLEYSPNTVDLVSIVQNVKGDLVDLVTRNRVSFAVYLDGEKVNGQGRLEAKGAGSLCHFLLMNLMKNAVEATPEGGTVTLRLCSGDPCGIEVHNVKPVPASMRECFFEKFATHGKPGGAGIGTYAAKCMTEAMGGTVAMTTDEEAGTTVTVSLPSVH